MSRYNQSSGPGSHTQTYKIVVVGGGGVGKSAITIQFIQVSVRFFRSLHLIFGKSKKWWEETVLLKQRRIEWMRWYNWCHYVRRFRKKISLNCDPYMVCGIWSYRSLRISGKLCVFACVFECVSIKSKKWWMDFHWKGQFVRFQREKEIKKKQKFCNLPILSTYKDCLHVILKYSHTYIYVISAAVLWERASASKWVAEKSRLFLMRCTRAEF